MWFTGRASRRQRLAIYAGSTSSSSITKCLYRCQPVTVSASPVIYGQLIELVTSKNFNLLITRSIGDNSLIISIKASNSITEKSIHIVSGVYYVFAARCIDRLR